MTLETERLLLRPWEETDAEECYRYAKDPLVGPAAGWPVHLSPEHSRQVIREVLMVPETYAIVLKETGLPIGSIGLHHNDLAEKDDEAELGYWLGVPYWGRGLVPEAAREMLRHAFEELNLNRVWCAYYDGNEKSKRVQEKLGFSYQWTTERVPVPQLGEVRKGHVNLMTKEQWEGQRRDRAMKVRIALLQLLPEQDLAGQLEKGRAACVRAKEQGADIALFPEMWSDGYALPQDPNALETLAIDADSSFVRAFGELAASLEMAIGITFLEKHAPKPRNSLILFDRTGVPQLHYAKVHTCDFDLEQVLSSGEEFCVTELDLGRGTVQVGAMICFDREYPESARVLMLKGAEVILAPNACPMEINRLAALRTRAYENMLAVATCNYPAGQPDCNGRSTVFDGIAWLRTEPDVRDMCILEAPEEEGVYLAEIDLALLRDYRRSEVMGWKYRHPAAYGVLTEE